VIDLIEYGEEKEILKDLITEDDIIYLNKLNNLDDNRSDRFNLKIVKNNIVIKPLSYVGMIQLNKIKINIYPRFDKGFSKLIQLLSFCSNNDINYEKVDTKSKINNLSFPEIIISLLLSEVEKIIKKGAFRDYKSYEKNLKTIRGRVDFKKQITRNLNRKNKIYCKYEEMDTNIIENRILLKAIDISRKIAIDKNLQKEVNKYYNLFSKYCDQYIDKKLPDIIYHRLNYYYKDAHFYSDLIINKIGVEDIYRDNRKSCYSFLFDMNYMFEQFVSRLFKEYYSKNYKINSQKNISDAIITQNNSNYRKIKPDLIIENKNNFKKSIIDAKNKNYGDNKILNSDIYQLSFYGMYFSDYYKDEISLALIHPKYKNDDRSFTKININSYNKNGATFSINIIPLEINNLLDLIKENEKNKITSILESFNLD